MRANSNIIWNNNPEEKLLNGLSKSCLISVTNPKGIIVYVNDMFCDISGYSEKELLGNNPRILKSGKQHKKVYKDLWGTICNNNIWQGKLCNKRKNGEFYWVNVTIIPFVDDNGQIEKYVAICFDITKFINDKGGLANMEKKFKLLFESSIDAYFISNLEGKILNCNSAATTMSGYSKKEIINKKLSDSVLVSESDRNYLNSLLKVPSKEPHGFEFQFTSKNGKKIDIEMVSHNAFIEDERIILNIARDITKRKETLNELQQKTDDLELLLYRSGHDLRTPFTSLEGLLSLMKQESLNEKTAELLEMFESVLNNGKLLIENLSASSLMYNKSVELGPVNINKLIRQTIIMLRHFEGFQNVSFNVNIPEGFKFNSNELLLTGIFQNLLQNAIKYQRPRNTNHTPFIIINAFKTKGGVEISIKDNGRGINHSELDKIFDLYYRSKTTVDGTGLGLYIVKNSVKQLNGIISVKSVVNKETQFDINLPNLSLKL